MPAIVYCAVRLRAVYRAAVLVLLAALLPLSARADVAGDVPESGDHALIARQLAAMPPQRAGHPDLFVIGVAGDGREQVFANEVEYLAELAARRLDAQGRVITLVNRPGNADPPQPAATLNNLRQALRGIGERMESEHDLLLLYMASHGTPDHRFVLADRFGLDALISPQQLRQALDEAGIGNRIVVVSACFSGGFIPELRAPGTVVMTAARFDRSSFGCGADAQITWFGRAWLVDGMNTSTDPVTAFQHARKAVGQREGELDYPPSHPQMDIGPGIRERIRVWHASLPDTPALALPSGW